MVHQGTSNKYKHRLVGKVQCVQFHYGLHLIWASFRAVQPVAHHYIGQYDNIVQLSVWHSTYYSVHTFMWEIVYVYTGTS